MVLELDLGDNFEIDKNLQKILYNLGIKCTS